MNYVPAVPVSLRNSAEHSEKWLQERITEQPQLLGLGDVVVRDVERRQPRAGRLDLLLQHIEEPRRYVVEVQLGPTDEKHIVRCLDYWRREESRRSRFEHVAVLVAENMNSRYAPLVQQLSLAFPLIGIQLNAWRVGEALTLTTASLFDGTLGLGDEDDEEASGETTTRQDWEKQASIDTLRMADEVCDLVRSVTGDPGYSLTYRKFYVGLSRNGVPRNVVLMKPRIRHIQADFKSPPLGQAEEAALRAAGIDLMSYEETWARVRMRLYDGDLVRHRDLLAGLVRDAVAHMDPDFTLDI